MEIVSSQQGRQENKTTTDSAGKEDTRGKTHLTARHFTSSCVCKLSERSTSQQSTQKPKAKKTKVCGRRPIFQDYDWYLNSILHYSRPPASIQPPRSDFPRQANHNPSNGIINHSCTTTIQKTKQQHSKKLAWYGMRETLNKSKTPNSEVKLLARWLLRTRTL